MLRTVGWTLGVWLLFVPLGVLNGAFREGLLNRWLGPGPALPLSGLSLALLILATVWWLLPALGPATPRMHWRIGILWVLLTVGFEFAFGRLVAAKTWEQLLAAYNPVGGNLWLAVLAVIALAPRVLGPHRSPTDRAGNGERAA
jgi:hypothetical protein